MALARADEAERLLSGLRARFYAPRGADGGAAQLILTRPAGGARLLGADDVAALVSPPAQACAPAAAAVQ
jgi:hypothetical protein